MEEKSDTLVDLSKECGSYTIVPYLGYQLPESFWNMILSKWLRSLRYGNEYFKLIESQAYYVNYHKYIESVLARPNVVVRLAVLTDDRDVCLGFSISELHILHFIHIHKDQRKQGIGKSLVPLKEITVITHLTNIGMTLWPRLLPKAIFNPFA